MKGMVLFKGHITTRSPFANSPPGAKDRDNVALLPRLPVGGVPQPAVMPSVLRAAFRQCAAEEVVERLKAAGVAVNFHDFALSAVGGVKGSRKDDDAKVGIDLRSQYVRRQHLVGLFGAGESPVGFAAGAWNIGPAIATQADVAIVEGSRRPLNDDPRLTQVLDLAELRKAREFGDANRARSKAQAELRAAQTAMRKAKDPQDKARLADQAKAIEASLAGLKSKSAELLSDVAIGMPLPGYEVIGVNATMAHRMDIALAGDPARLGLALAALERFGVDPRVGAHQSLGCGYVEARWDVVLREPEGRRLRETPLGSVSLDPDAGTRIDGQALAGALAAWDAAGVDGDLYRAGFDVTSLADRADG